MIVLQLVQNIALLMALALIHQVFPTERGLHRFWSHPRVPSVLSGLAFGAFGVVGMLTPLVFAPGVIFDGRSIILAVAGMFGGPVVAAIAAVMCGAYRLWLGGGGALMGVSVIAEASALGVAFHYWRRRNPRLAGYFPLWGFGLLVHAVMVACMLLLPEETRWEVIWHIGPPVLLVYPLATMVVCRLFIDQETRAKNEAALLESEAKYRELVESANSIILRWTTSGTITYINEFGLRFFGYSMEEIVGRHVVGTIVPPTDTAGKDLAEMIRGVIAHPERYETNQNENMRRDGTRVWVAWTNRPVFDDQGQCLGMFAVGNDITELRRTEDALRESEVRFQRLLDEAPYPLVVTDHARGVILYINQPGADLFEMDKQACLGMETVAFYGEDSLRDRMMALLHRDGTIRDQELMMRTARGRLFHAQISVNVAQYEGKEAALISFMDITERKRAEGAVNESNRLFSLFMQHSPIYAFIKSVTPTESRVLQASDNFAEMVGIPGSEMIGKTMTDLFPAGFAEKITADDWSVVSTGTVLKQDEELNGRSYTTIKFPIVQGEKTLLAGYTIDITARKQAEEALRLTHERLRQFVDANIVGVLVATSAGAVVEANDYYLNLVGVTRDELKEGRLNWRTLTAPEWLSADEKALGELRERGKCTPYEKEYLRRDGSRVPVLLVDAMLPGPEEHIAAFVLDLSDRKRAEEEYRTLFREMLEGFALHEIICDASGTPADYRYLAVNPAFERMTGLKAVDVLGRTVLEVLPGIERHWIETYGNVALTGEPAFFENYSADLDKHFEVTAFQPVPGQFACIFADITDRKRAEEEKGRLEAQLRQAQKMESVGRLAGGVAHDFNNMLGVILGFTDMALLQVEPAQPLHDDLEEIRKAAERSADLTRQLLAFARRQTVAPRMLDLNETVVGSLKMMQRLIGENVSLYWVPGPNLWPVRMDPSQIDQILANLCVNARDAIADTGKISIETQNRAVDTAYCAAHAGLAPGEYVLLTVADDGCGMDKKTLGQIFEPFFTTKEIGKGTGLGLATIYGIVKQNNGFIDVRSELGKGTTFEIFLPRHGGAERAKMEGMPDAVMSGHETILLVEDEAAFLKLARVVLEGQGYTVLAANTPGEAVRLAREQAGEISLLITDVIMPEMNGRDLARNLLSLYPNLRRLYMSGYTADVIAHQGVLEPGTHFIQKPFSAAKLGQKVREVLDGK